MKNYLEVALEGYQNYANYLWQDIANPQWNSYFYMLIAVSLVFFILEVLLPWRKQQKILRKDFFLDTFYMFFNFFLFSLVVYNAASDVFVNLFNDGIAWITGGFDLQASNPLQTWPLWSVLLVGFVVRDFIQWWVHRLLHRAEFLWNFHQVHHSVEEMGFAAHLRYHWMETIVYRTVEYLPLALLGIGLYDFFIIHLFTLAWGHYNHANLKLSKRVTGAIVGGLLGLTIGAGAFGVNVFSTTSFATVAGSTAAGLLAGASLLAPVMPYLFNSPEMHLWHHAKELPEERRYGVNFGLTLAIWDYLFGTDYQPYHEAEMPIGFAGVEEFPDNFTAQVLLGMPGGPDAD